jgi:hypothetical protein
MTEFVGIRYELIVAPGTVQKVDFKKAPNLICHFMNASRTDPKSQGRLVLTAEAQDVESDAKDLDTAQIVTKKLTLVEFAEGEAGTKRVQFQCVKDSETKFTLEGDSGITLSGLFNLYDAADQEEEEEDSNETP